MHPLCHTAGFTEDVQSGFRTMGSSHPATLKLVIAASSYSAMDFFYGAGSGDANLLNCFCARRLQRATMPWR